MGRRPEPCILFAQTFIHSQLDDYVDEVSWFRLCAQITD